MNIQSNNTSIATHVFAETSKTIRTVTIDDDIMFIAKDVAEALGYKDTKKAIAAHCRKAITIDLRDVGNEANHPPIISAGNPNAKAIPESDVYRLIMRSKLPAAESFEDWVVEEVLPSIRNAAGVSGLLTTNE